MKRSLLIFIVSALFVLTAFTYSRGQQTSLNGYLYGDFVTMRNSYVKNHLSAQTTFVWFDLSVITQINAMLDDEQTNRTQVIDGIRIYYVQASGQNTVLLVSTYNNGTNSDGFVIHQDYFDHDMTKYPLFKNKNIHGDPHSDINNYSGAALYSSCGIPCSTDQACTIPPSSTQIHYITRKSAEDMVHMLEIPNTTAVITKSEWFPRCMFQGIDTAKYDGVRIYYGRHTPDHPVFPNKEAFVIELTSRDGSDHKDAFDCTYAQCSAKKINELITKYFSKEQRKANNTLFQKKIKAFIVSVRANGQDNGELCPSHCDGTTMP